MQEHPVQKNVRRGSESTTVKMIVLGLLILILLIPVVSIASLVRERSFRQDSVRAEIAGRWGRQQTLNGPILRVPFRVPVEEVKEGEGRRIEQRDAYFLPLEIRWQGEVQPEVRYRGIFEAVVYESRLTAAGTFERPWHPSWSQPGVEVLWEQAALTVGIPDVRGLQGRSSLAWGDEELAFEPGGQACVVSSGIHVPIRLDPTAGEEATVIPFSFDLSLRGSERLAFVPTGEETVVELAPPWNDPSFDGEFLPAEREVTEAGFTATWRVPYFGRSFPQSWVGTQVAEHQLVSSAFGAQLVLPADGYQQTTRSVKYAVLFILLTFVTFFLIEIVSPVRLHAAQYLLIGFSLCMFYVLLLAGSEHIGFGAAYAVATGAIVLLVAGYSRSILRSGRWSTTLGLCLAGLYGYLYVLLQLEEFALLLGALGLFVILTLVMYLTRHLDWRTLSFEDPATAPVPEA